MGTSKQPVTLVHEARFTEGGEAEGAAGVKSRLGGGGGGLGRLCGRHWYRRQPATLQKTGSLRRPRWLEILRKL